MVDVMAPPPGQSICDPACGAPGVIAAEIAEDLQTALDQFSAIADDLQTPR